MIAAFPLGAGSIGWEGGGLGWWKWESLQSPGVGISVNSTDCPTIPISPICFDFFEWILMIIIQGHNITEYTNLLITETDMQKTL